MQMQIQQFLKTFENKINAFDWIHMSKQNIIISITVIYPKVIIAAYDKYVINI